MKVTDTHRELLRRYPQAVVHLRQLLQARRLGVVLGAGVSLEAGLPSWSDLVSGIKGELVKLGVAPNDVEKESEPVQTQILFSRFRHFCLEDPDVEAVDASYRDAEIASRWRQLVHDVLYADVDNLKDLLDAHPYMEALSSVTQRLPLVVSYNFDDLLEKALSGRASLQPEKSTVGYYSSWGANFVLQDGRPVVYHPNGYLPFNLVDRYSDSVVLTEEALSDQAIDYSLGGYATLLDHYAKQPCLFIGFSLADASMRNLLRQAVRRAPGNVHYYIKYIEDDVPNNFDDIKETNFDLFNMVTIPLNSSQIQALLELVSIGENEVFEDICHEENCPTFYKYYIVGPVSVGKTSVVSHLRGVDVVDEWLTDREPLISKPSNKLSVEETELVDAWIMQQIRLKNMRFYRAQPGLHVMDRAPLDAFAFTPEGQHQDKALQIADNGRGMAEKLQSGCVIFLKGREYDLALRQKWRGRGGDAEYLRQQQSNLDGVYGPVVSDGVYQIDTSGQSLDLVVRKVLKQIHLSDYREFDFEARLQKYTGVDV